MTNENCDTNFKEALKHFEKRPKFEQMLITTFCICSILISAGITIVIIKDGSPLLHEYLKTKIQNEATN